MLRLEWASRYLHLLVVHGRSQYDLSTLEFSTELIGRLSEHPNIVGIKDSRGQLDLAVELVGATAADFQGKPRADLLAKMDKVKPDEATPAERAACGITKMRYLQFREASTTTRTLGFRIDAIQLAEGLHDVVR